MWNVVLSFLMDYAPFVLSIVSVVVHFFVFHRLKCTKNLAECLKDCVVEKKDTEKKVEKKDTEKKDFEPVFDLIRDRDPVKLRPIFDLSDDELLKLVRMLCDDLKDKEVK